MTVADRKTANYAIRSLARWDFDAFAAIFMPRLKSVLKWEDMASIRYCIKHDGFCIENDGFGIKHDEFCI